MIVKYFFEQYKDNPVVNVRVGINARATIRNGYAELNPKNEHDKLIIDTYKGVEAPKEKEEKTKTTTRKLKDEVSI